MQKYKKFDFVSIFDSNEIFYGRILEYRANEESFEFIKFIVHPSNQSKFELINTNEVKIDLKTKIVKKVIIYSNLSSFEYAIKMEDFDLKNTYFWRSEIING